MGITITEKDVGRKVRLRNGNEVAITKWDRLDTHLPIETEGHHWHRADGSSCAKSGNDIIAFADEPAPAETTLTEARVREIVLEAVREAIQPQPEKKDLLRRVFWINFDADGDANFYRSKGRADVCANSDRIACKRVEVTEGEFDEEPA